MKQIVLLVFVLFGVMAAQEIRRPTTAAASSGTGSIYCSGTYSALTATSVPNMYDTTNPPPNATSGTFIRSGPNVSAYRWGGYIFSGWAAASGAYSALTINIRASESDLYGTSLLGFIYSLNGGSTWNALASDSNMSATTYTATIPAGTTLTSVQFGVCLMAGYSDPDLSGDASTASIYDIWTSGTLASTSSSKTIGVIIQ